MRVANCDLPTRRARAAVDVAAGSVGERATCAIVAAAAAATAAAATTIAVAAKSTALPHGQLKIYCALLFASAQWLKTGRKCIGTNE